MRAFIEGVGLCGPGLNGWAKSRASLAGVEPYQMTPVVVPPCELLPANERRRMVTTVKLALAVGIEALADAKREATEIPTIFTSSGGDGETVHQILQTLALPEREISPTRFHNSVHNAPAGYWNIATQSRAASTSLCCHDFSFAAGLLEAMTMLTADECPVALIAYDLPYPEPLHAVRPIDSLFGVALILTPQSTSSSRWSLALEISEGPAQVTTIPNPHLEQLRQGNPAARSLPLLAALSRNIGTSVTLDYLAHHRIILSVAGGAQPDRR